MGISLIWETVPIKTQIYAWYDYTITLIKRENDIISYLRNEWSLFIWVESPSFEYCFMLSFVEICPVILDFVNKFNVFLLFGYHLPLGKVVTQHLNKIKITSFPRPSCEDALFQVWVTLAKWFLRSRFLNFVNVFSILLLSSLGKERGLSFEPTWYKQTYTLHFLLSVCSTQRLT